MVTRVVNMLNIVKKLEAPEEYVEVEEEKEKLPEGCSSVSFSHLWS